MDKNILKQMYKPICILEYEDEYFDGLIDVIENSCSDESFEWYIRCIKYFMNIDDEFNEEFINLLDGIDEDSSFDNIEKNKAELSVFAQAIIYERIMNGADKNLALTLSLSLNTIMFGREVTLNQFHIDRMKSFYREINKERMMKYKEPSETETDKDIFNFMKTENNVLKWLLNMNIPESSELDEKQFALNLGKELAKRCGTQTIFNYPEAYLTKILLSSPDRIDLYSDKIPVKEVFNLLNFNDVSLDSYNSFFPLLSKTLKYYTEFSLIDYAIEVYYEQMLFNHIKVNNYVG